MRYLALVLAACSAGPTTARHAGSRDASAPLSLAVDDRMVVVPAGRFISGSTPEERATAYEDHATTSGDEAARTGKWFEREANRHQVNLPAFRIDLMPVTQAQFAELVTTGQVAAPAIDEAGWRALGLEDFATHAPRFVWHDGRPPDGREDHPVVLVSWTDAERYCTWRGSLRGEKRRLPTADEFEKATRGDSGIPYPWGPLFEADKLNSAVSGPHDTTPVGSYGPGASPYGLLDMAGNVMQWTATPADGDAMVVKGSSWHSFAGLGRGAALDRRARSTRDVRVGFRCAADAPPGG